MSEYQQAIMGEEHARSKKDAALVFGDSYWNTIDGMIPEDPTTSNTSGAVPVVVSKACMNRPQISVDANGYIN